MTHTESIELTNLEYGKLSEDQIRRIFRYARIMLNIFRLSPKTKNAISDLEQRIENTNNDFVNEGLMVSRAALCLLVRSSESSQFYVTEEYDLGISHEQGFRLIIDGNIALGRKAEYVSGLAVDVYFLEHEYRNLNLVNFDRLVMLNEHEERMVKARTKKELNGESVMIFTQPL